MQISGRQMDAVADLLGGGRTIAYKTDLAHATQSITAGLLLSQIWYWSNMREVIERDGWFWKTAEEIREETGMGRYEMEAARKRLKELEILQEDRRGVPAKLWYRLDKEKLYLFLSEYATNKFAGNQQTGLLETSKLDSGKPANKGAGNQQSNSKTTAETTSKDYSSRAQASQKPLDRSLSEASAAADFADADIAKMLIDCGVNRSDAARLAREKPDECRCQLEFLPFKGNDFTSGRGAYLRAAIEGGYAPPKGYEEQERKRRRAEKQAEAQKTKQSEALLRAAEMQASDKALANARDTLSADPEVWAEICSEAEARVPPIIRAKPKNPAFRVTLERNIEEIVMQRAGLSHAEQTNQNRQSSPAP